MNKSSQTKVTADLLGRTLHPLDELGIPYALVLEGVPTIFSNSSPIHAQAIIERQWMLGNKISELEIEQMAEKRCAIPPRDED